MKTTIVLLLLAVSLGYSAMASAETMFRCTDSDFVHRGDSSTTVMMKCGSPAVKEESTGYGARYKEETWVYRHPNNAEWATALHFKRGKMIKVENLGRFD
ncbi:MAG: DUF2845 domain-containing protein [Gammaproteobacteria bacterium]|nr:DUF2845 domain-containing protein [Gammaproteobacteria bacterium]